ncbi:MAG: xanthine dehydrogenase family protein subunit M [Desulfobacterales bacterium]|jgi:xanthine dehydrogenase YagS FAD-binding subunit|nr:xanthine dehydrogenase family protein subunit M [Desulfobacterales bacterium]
MLPNFDYVRPKSVQAAVAQLSADGARAHAGGTDLLGCLRERILPTGRLVSLNDLRELQGVSETAEGGLRIGALTTLSALAEHPVVRKRYAALAQAASEVGSPQLRNQGTIGGNLCQKPRCWYYRADFTCLRKGGGTCFAVDGENQFHCIFGGGGVCFIVHPSDTAPALAAFNATVRVVGPKGVRNVPLDKFFVLPEVDVQRETVLARGELVTEIRIPPPGPGTRSSYRKVRARRAWDFALAGVALALRFEGRRVVDGRVVLSGAAPVPWRSTEAEQALRGRELTAEVVAAAAKAATAGAEPLEKNGYKIPLIQGMIADELTRMST